MYFPEVISRSEQNEFIKKISSMSLNFEGGDEKHYANSYGATMFPYNPAATDNGYSGVEQFYKNIFERLTPMMEATYQQKLKPSGLYGRIYRNGAKLGIHVDQPHLQYTASLCILAPDVFWPLYVENVGGDNPNPLSISIQNRDAAAMEGTKAKHWRDVLHTSDMDMGMYVFFHWEADKSFILDDTRILDSESYYIKDGFISEELANEANSLIDGCQFIDSMVREGDVDRVNLAVRSNKTTNVSSHPERLKRIIAEVDRRVLNMIGGVSPARLEGAVVLRYFKGQYFVPHHDCNHTPSNDREFTYILFLNDVEEGGETNLIGYGISVTPKKGTILVWRNMKDGVCDQRSLHEGAPIIKGQKTVLVNWIFEKEKQL